MLNLLFKLYFNLILFVTMSTIPQTQQPQSNSKIAANIPSYPPNDLDNLQAQLDLYENSFNQLKKDLPIYLSKHSESSKTCKALVKSLRSVASSETNASLQNSLFTKIMHISIPFIV